MACGKQYYVASIAGLWTQAIAYGVYLTLFTRAIRALHQAPPNKLWSVTVVLFVLGTTLVLVDFVKLAATPKITADTFCVGTTCFSCGRDNAAVGEMSTLNVFDIVGDGFAAIARLITGMFLVSRCMQFWRNHRWVAVLPALLLIADAAVSFVRVSAIGQRKQGTAAGSSIVSMDEVSSAARIAHLFLFPITNLVISVLLILPLRKLWMNATETDRSWFDGFCAIVTESATIYTLVAIVLTLTSIFSPVFSIIPDGIEVQLAGIVPTMIVIRICRGKSLDPTRLRFVQGKQLDV